MYLGDDPERCDMEAGGIIHVEAGTALQAANHGADELLVYVYGAPPETETERVELLDPAV
jgi:predicted metal-dependent enzyme (double-stranded beta helix superfamily)